jgi:lipopolysaccharide heptosyltransferase II
MKPIHAARRGLDWTARLAFALYGAWGWLVGPRPRLPLNPATVRRILVIRLDLLGDAIFSIPALEALGAAYPEAQLDVLALPYTVPILQRVPAVARVYALDVNRLRRPTGWREVGPLLGTVRELRAQRYDLAVGISDLMGGVFAVASGARWRAGYRGASYRGAYNIALPGRRYRPGQHEVDYTLDLVRAVTGARSAPSYGDQPGPVAEVRPGLAAHWSSVLTSGERHGGGVPVPYVVLVPGASNGAAKRWPAAHWSALGQRLGRELGQHVVLSGSAAERELLGTVARGLDVPYTDLGGRTNVEELAALLAGASVVVAGDTGPLHLAAALGTPVLGIYGPTDPANTGPRGAAARVVRLGLTCSPCYDLHTPADCKLPDRSMPCMWGITPDRVFDAATELLDRDPSRSPVVRAPA